MMTGPQTEEQWRLAEALPLKQLYSADAPRFIAGRISLLAPASDCAGVKRMHEIATAFEKLLVAKRGRAH